MRRILFVVLTLALVATASACREDFFDPTPGGTGPQQQRLELIARNLVMIAGEENAIRIGFGAKDPSAYVRVERPDGSGRVVACPLRSVDDPLPDQATCLPDAPDGVRESISLSGIGAIALIREGDPITVEIRVDFEEGDRKTTVRMPILDRPAGASACKDNACNPVFELLPVRAGAFTAMASWTGGAARLEVLEGRVLARSFSSTGIPYRIAGQGAGSSPLSVTARLSGPTEYALALVNTSEDVLRRITIEATWS
ncbi:MAG: hypothetical protein ACRDKG_05185 [Actinomycetota bacterium]